MVFLMAVLKAVVMVAVLVDLKAVSKVEQRVDEKELWLVAVSVVVMV